MKKQSGEIATVLTFLSIGLMLLGVAVGSIASRKETRLLTKAAGCPSGEWECTVGGATHCSDAATREIFSGTWCDGEKRWKWEDAGKTDKCGGSPDKLIPANGVCSETTPTSAPSGGCPAGQWTCTVGSYTRCSDGTAQGLFNNNWCEPMERWQYETAKLLGGNGSECNGKESKPKPDCSGVTATPNPSGNCPTFQWNCTFDGKTYCSDEDAKSLFLGTWCDGKARWLWEKAGNTNKCGGSADIPLNSPDCKRNPITTQNPTPVPTAAPNPTRAGSPGGFHLTSDIYAEKATDGIKFNVHILFNSDGCDGDVKLYRDGGLVGGPNGWNIKMGPFDYNQEWAGSFTVKRGESVSPGYEGTVDRCPKSTTTLRDSISCTLAVDGSGNPGVTGAGCTFKNQSDFSAYNPASPTLGAASGPGGKYKCQDLTSSPNKDCNDTMAGPCEYGTYKYKCMSGACPSNSAVGVGIPFWCDGEKWYDVNKAGECSNACTPAGSPTPTPSSECQGKADGFVISSCIQQECEVPNKKWINLEKVCQGGIAYTKPGKLTSDSCNPQTDKFRACQPGNRPREEGGICAPGISCRDGLVCADMTGSGSFQSGICRKPTPTPVGGLSPTPIPASELLDIKIGFKANGVCRTRLGCQNEYDGSAEFWYKQGNSAPQKTILNLGDGFDNLPGADYQYYRGMAKLQKGVSNSGSVTLHYKNQGKDCYASTSDTFIPGPTDTEWSLSYTLNSAYDCKNPGLEATPPILRGSSNQAFLAAIENYTKGNMGAKEMSTFISQLSRTPGTQVQLVPCDYTQPQCGFNI